MNRVFGTLIALICFGVFGGGCAGPTQSKFHGLSPQRSFLLSQQMTEARERDLRQDLASAFDGRAGPRNVLVLSGGDADGAFGCGVLTGWRRAPGGRPSFDVVTGI